MGPLSRIVVAVLPLVPKPVVGIAARRYVAGETIDQAMAAIRRLKDEGAMATIDVLGEEVRERERAELFTRQYVDVFDRLKREQVDSTVSVKLTMLGLKLDVDFCRANLELICQEARRSANFLRIDMEDHTVTDVTLELYREMLAKYGNVGAVLQSYMRRTLDDIRAMPASGVNIRLCKGIYVEPEAIAYKGYQEVRDNFVAALELMLQRGIYPAIATHDSWLIERSYELIAKYGLQREQYEFQMLYGVQPKLRRKIIAAGHRLRVYVPFGKDWHPYSVRRLRENPAVAGHIIKAFLGLG